MYKTERGYIGFSSEAVFFTLKPNIDSALVDTISSKNKKALGDRALVIDRAKIAFINTASNDKYSTFIGAKGMGDDIAFNARSKEVQDAILSETVRLVGNEGKVSKKEAGIVRKAGGSILLAICFAAISLALFYLVTSLDGAAVELSGRNAGLKELLYNVASFLGPVGTLVAGAAVVGLCLFKVYKATKVQFVLTARVFS